METIVDGSNINGCFYLNNANPIIDGFTITNGYFGYLGDGGGVYCYYGGTVQNCIISGNSANEVGGVYCYYGGIVQNCNINRNLASNNSGGVRCDSGGPVQNCTISRNSASSDGGVNCSSGGTIQNCIIWDNVNGNSFSFDSANFYNCIENWTNLVNGIITNNPQFVDVSSGSYRLKTNSPCINVGTNMIWMVGAKDLDGNPRITDVIVDMGCYEFVPKPVGMIVMIFN